MIKCLKIHYVIIDRMRSSRMRSNPQAHTTFTSLRMSVCFCIFLMACGEDFLSDEIAAENFGVNNGKADDNAQSTGECPNGIWNGDVTTEAGLYAAQDCTHINGNIELAFLSGMTGIEFPLLEQD